MGPRLGRVEYRRADRQLSRKEFLASMGPRLGRVEYPPARGWLIWDKVLQWGHA